MGKASRRSAQRRVAQKAVMAPGITKRLLDRMHDESMRRYGVGLGVLVQEEDRARKRIASLETELADVPWRPSWRQLRRRRQLVASLEAASDDYRTWKGRLGEVTAACTPDADMGELLRVFRDRQRV